MAKRTTGRQLSADLKKITKSDFFSYPFYYFYPPSSSHFFPSLPFVTLVRSPSTPPAPSPSQAEQSAPSITTSYDSGLQARQERYAIIAGNEEASAQQILFRGGYAKNSRDANADTGARSPRNIRRMGRSTIGRGGIRRTRSWGFHQNNSPSRRRDFTVLYIIASLPQIQPILSGLWSNLTPEEIFLCPPPENVDNFQTSPLPRIYLLNDSHEYCHSLSLGGLLWLLSTRA